MDIATLGVRIVQTGVKETTSDLARMGDQGTKTEAQLRGSLQRTIAQIRQMQEAWKGAAISDLAFVDGVKQLQVQADQTRRELSQLIGAQEQAAATSGTMGTAASGAALHVGRLRSSLGTLAAQALGTNPAIIEVSSALAQLGVGQVVTVAVLAGIAAIAAALDKLGAGARKAQADYDKMLESLRHESLFAAIGGQLDAVQHKLDNLSDGFLGAATRVTRAVLSRSLLGQMFGVQSEDELKAEAARLGQESAQAFQSAQAQAREKVRKDLFSAGISNSPGTQDALAGFQTDQIQNIQNALKSLQTTLLWYTHPPDRNTIFKDLTQQGQTAAETVRLVNAAINGGGAVFMMQGGGAGQSGLGATADKSKEIADHWNEIGRAIVASGQALGSFDDQTAAALQNVISMGEALANIASAGGKAASGDIVGLIAGFAGLISGLGAESAAARRSREIQQQNTDAIRKLTDVFTLQVTGSARVTGTAATDALLGVKNGGGAFGAGGLIGPKGTLDLGAVNAVLGAQGTTLQAYKDFAKSLGITLDTSTAQTFINSLRQLDEQLKKSELAHFADTFGGKMKLLNAQLSALNITDPLAKLRRTIAVLTGSQGAPAFTGALNGVDVGSAGGRGVAIQRLLAILNQIQGGSFDTTQTGGLSLQEFLDQLVSTIDLLRQVDDTSKQRDDALQATIDSLHQFSDSLKLSDLTTLSPVQQLADARRQYQAILVQAQAGDQAAAAQLPQAARDFLNASRAVNASGPRFAADFQAVLAQTDAIAKLFEGQKSQGDQMVAYTGDIAYNTAAMVDTGKDQVAVLKEGFSVLTTQQAEMQAAIEQLIKETRAGSEGGRL